jgi:hypothetical protein
MQFTSKSLPVRPYYEDFLIHCKVLSVPTSDISADGAIRLLLQEALDDGPGLLWVSHAAVGKEWGDAHLVAS